MDFDKQKDICMTKLKEGDDRSKKGSVDKGIKDLIDTINKKEDLYTTSSCSGRMMLYTKPERKCDTRWLFVSHEPVCEGTLWKELVKIEKITKEIEEEEEEDTEVWFKQESFILHVACRNLDAAGRLLDTCKNNGLKRIGIQSMKNKVMVEILYHVGFKTPVYDKRVLVDEAYAQKLEHIANQNMKKNKKKIEDIKASFSRF